MFKSATNARPWSGRLAAAAGVGAVFFLLGIGAIALARGSALVAPMWPANALGLIFVLRWSRSQIDTAVVLAAILVASVVANSLGGSTALNSVWLSALNVTQIAVGCALVRRFASTTFRTVGEGWRFFAVAGPPPSLLGGLGVLVLCKLTERADGLAEAITWTGADLLGFILIGPLGMTLSMRELMRLDLRRRWREALAVYLLLAGVTFATFAQTALPLLFVVAPFILLATFRFRLIGANAAMIIVAAVAIPLTSAGLGPLALLHGSSLSLRLLTLQAFLALNGLSAVPLAAALSQRDLLMGRSERREAELLRAAKIAQIAEDVVTSGHWTLRLATSEQIWSAGVFRIFGLPFADRPPPLAEVLAQYPPDARLEVRIALETAARERRGVDFDHPIVRTDGAVRRLRVRSQFVELNGEAQLLGVVRDMTAEWEALRRLENSERNYRRLIEGVTDYAIYFLDPKGFVVSWNAGAELIKGYAAAEIVGKHVSIFYTGLDRKTGLPARALAVAAAEGRFIDEGWRVRKDGSRLRASVVIDAVREDGKLVGFANITRDVTARHQADVALQQALQDANAANTAKSDFLANMSHEIRTPLHSIMGFSGLLAGSEELPLESRRKAEVVHIASRSLMRLIDDILDISKFEVEGVSLAPEPTDLPRLIEDAVELVRASAAAKGVDLRLSVELDPGPVLIDPVRVRQVLLNLLGNALKFSPEGEVIVTLSAHGDGGVRIAVSDTGVGIPADRLARIFDRFAQADGSTSRRFGGTGLGLAICRSIISAMGGEIGVESVEGAGSTFAFSFTPMPVDATRPAAPAADVAAIRPGLRVLLADDNELNRDLFGELMKGRGLEISYAVDGAEAVQAVRAQHFDMVFMDVQMPIMNGMEATRAIRGAGFIGLPVLALTANVLDSQIEQFRAAGMSGHIGKPYGSIDILQALAAHVPAQQGPALSAAPPVADEVLAQLSASLGAEKTASFLVKLSSQLGRFAPQLAILDADPRMLAPEAHRVRGFAAMLGFAAIEAAYMNLETAPEGAANADALRRAALEATQDAMNEIARRLAA